ncbi:MAG: hypothetical protein ACLQGP_37270 [Isosphaeraceae bacterium]
MIERPSSGRRFRIVDGIILVAATAIAFAIYRQHDPVPSFTTFDGRWEQWLFEWMHRVVPFTALWSYAVFAIARRDQRTGRRARARHAGVVACYAATLALAVTSIISSGFYIIHTLEDAGRIPKILSHGTQSHSPIPFASAPMEEIIGASVLGAWTAMAAGRRWRVEASWIDRFGRLLGVSWIGLFLIYVYAYMG